MRIAQTEVTGVHPFVDGIRLPCVHKFAHGMLCPLLRGNWGERYVEAEKMHVKHETVMVRAMCSALPRETAAHTRHAGVETLHGLIQTVLGATAHHDIGMSQLLMVTLQELANNHHNRRLNARPSGGKGLKELGRREGVPTRDCVQNRGRCLISNPHGVVRGRTPACQRCSWWLNVPLTRKVVVARKAVRQAWDVVGLERSLEVIPLARPKGVTGPSKTNYRRLMRKPFTSRIEPTCVNGRLLPPEVQAAVGLD